LIIIYTPKVTNRIRYAIDFVFRQHFGIDYEISESPVVIQPDRFFISYGPEKLKSYFSVYRDFLLLETDIKQQHIFVSREMAVYNNHPVGGDEENETGYPVFFQTTEHYDLKFDIFSCIFYLLSRYEEYLPHAKDAHGRFLSSSSLLSKPAFNFLPVIEIWLEDFKQRMLSVYPSLQFKEYKFEFVPTIDIDNAFKYWGRNWFKHPANIFNKHCRDVIRKHAADPYDTLDEMVKVSVKSGVEPILFYLLSDDTEYDSKVSPDSILLHRLIEKHIAFQTGIHPSYNALQENKIESEKLILEKFSPVYISRQHFLRISFPVYYRALAKAGIRKDYSLAYPDVYGYRAGYSREFKFYDVQRDQELPVLLQPSAWMDATFEYYQTKNFSQISEEFSGFCRQLKKINSKLVTIFHNDLFATEKFRSVYIFVHHHVNSGV